MLMPDRRKLYRTNWGLLFATLLLFAVGLVNLYSASGSRGEEGFVLSSFYQKQMLWGLGGLAVMVGCMLFDYRRLERLALPFYVAVMVLLCLVPVIGKTVYGAKRWIDLGVMNLQPSELAKFAVLMMGASLLCRDGETLGWKRLFKVLLVGLAPFALIVRQPDLGTGLTVIVLLGGMVLFHGVKWRVLRVCLVAIPLLLPLGWFALHDYQRERVMTFLDPARDPRGAGYHIIQSQIAIGSGEIFGKGFLAGTQSQLRFLPEKHTDFAIAVLGEEWGFAGCMGLVALFCLFLYAMYGTVRDSRDRFGSTLAAGIFFYFFWQVIVNIGMVVGLMPVVGMPLPFISYGGTALVMNYALVGVVLSISMHHFVFQD
ncbi:MAG: rod shape-determining protein RodA [Mailhella sp.]|nr:rod shape-determining protein RodA [Mailhella sp.]